MRSWMLVASIMAACGKSILRDSCRVFSDIQPGTPDSGSRLPDSLDAIICMHSVPNTIQSCMHEANDGKLLFAQIIVLRMHVHNVD